MRRITASLVVVLVAVVIVAAMAGAFGTGAANGSGDPSYTVELNNAFGLIDGEQVKIAGVPAGSISSIRLDTKSLNALVKFQVSSGKYATFHSDATCQSAPQSLIGEYFIDCDPGTASTPVLPNGGLIPVSHTTSTIPADLIQNVMQMPYRERLTLIINELGAAVAGNPANLQSALQRAVPALTQTDNLLSLLAKDSHTIQNLTQTANTLISALAGNGQNIRRFVVNADKTAVDTATQDSNLQATFQNLPGFLQQLRPALKSLGAAAQANVPVLTNLNDSSSQINRLLTDLGPFSRSAQPALKSLGQASVTGHQAVVAAGPTVQHLNQFAAPTPELSQNLAIVLHDLDTQSKAVEPNPESPGGKGYSGLEALLQYGFEQTNAIDYFGQFGHILAVDAFVNECSPYQTQDTIKASLALYGSSFRRCYQFLGPNQPGVNERDPTDPSASIPDPGGAPPGEPGPTGSITTPLASSATSPSTSSTTAATTSVRAQRAAPITTLSSGGSSSGSGTSGTSGTPAPGSGSAPAQGGSSPINLGALGQLLGGLLEGGSGSGGSGSAGGGSSGSTSSGTSNGSGLTGLLGGLLGRDARSSRVPGATGASPARASHATGATASPHRATASPSPASAAASPSAPTTPTAEQAQQLLNYLLAP